MCGEFVSGRQCFLVLACRQSNDEARPPTITRLHLDPSGDFGNQATSRVQLRELGEQLFDAFRVGGERRNRHAPCVTQRSLFEGFGR